jgi:hypothetical protein
MKPRARYDPAAVTTALTVLVAAFTEPPTRETRVRVAIALKVAAKPTVMIAVIAAKTVNAMWGRSIRPNCRNGFFVRLG